MVKRITEESIVRQCKRGVATTKIAQDLNIASGSEIYSQYAYDVATTKIAQDLNISSRHVRRL